MAKRMAKAKADFPAGATSTTTPAGIAVHDPSVPKAKCGQCDGEGCVECNAIGIVPRVEDLSQQIAVHTIEWHPDNPRQDFDEEELRGLGASMLRAGTIQAIVVRPHPQRDSGGYEWQGLAGERRLRAAKLTEQTTILARVVDVDDDAALDIVVSENLDRKDLNPIEQARAIKALVASGMTQKQVAERYGHQQSWAANLLRLLDVPGEVQQMVIEKIIDQSMARGLVPYVDHPAVMAAIVKDMKSEPKHWDGDRDDFQQRLGSVIEEDLAMMGDDEWIIVKKLPEDQQTALGIAESVSVPVWDYRLSKFLIEKHDIITNVELWDQIQRELEEAEEAPAKSSDQTSEPSPSQAKAAEKKKAAERAHQYAERLKFWRRRWQRYVLAETRYKEEGGLESFDTRLLLWVAADFNSWDVRQRLNFAQMDASERLKYKPLQLPEPTWSLLRPADLDATLTEFIYQVLWPSSQPKLLEELKGLNDIPFELVGDWFEEVGPDLTSAWNLIHEEAHRERLREFLELHTKDQLFAQLQEWGIHDLAAGSARAVMVENLMARIDETFPLPKCLVPPAKVEKKKPAKKKGKKSA